MNNFLIGETHKQKNMSDIKITHVSNGSNLTILTGKVLDPKPPVPVNIEGDICTVSSFLKLRREQSKQITDLEPLSYMQKVKEERAIVVVNKKELTIKLLLDPENPYSGEIKGKLQISDELKQFSINANKTFTKEELVKLIKFNRLYFVDSDKHAGMVTAFQKVSSTVNISSNDSTDQRGNKERDYVKSVTTNAPTEFILNIPIFKGFEPRTFRVEVCLDVTDGSARFWFESVELHEIIQKETDSIFNAQLIAADGLVIIYE